MPRDPFVVLDARTSLRDIVSRVRTERAAFAVLDADGELYALRRHELEDAGELDLSALDALALAPWKASLRVKLGELGQHPLRDPTAPSSFRLVHLDAAGAPVRIEEPSPGRLFGGARDEGTSITRHPTLALDPRGGDLVTIVVDLAVAPDADAGDPIRFDELADDWTELPITVRVSSPQLDFEPGDDEGTILVRRDQASVRCRVAGRRRTDAVGAIEVMAIFFRRDRWCGSVGRTFDGAPAPAGAPIVVPSGAQPADLTVHIHRTERDRRRLVWSLFPASPHRACVPKASDESSLDDDPEPFVRALFAAAARRGAGQHVAALRGIGERLWALAPPALRDAYWAMRDQLGDGFSIQFITDEPHVPWELMRPLRGGARTGLLGETHPVARGLLAYPDRLRPALPAAGHVVTLAPDYTTRVKDRASLPLLPAAREESELLQDRFAAIAVRAIAPAFLALLEDRDRQPVRLLHYAGHGHVQTPADTSTIALEDTDVMVCQVRAQETVLGARYQTFVVFNACETGAAGEGLALGEVGGWAEAFTYCGFSGFVAPLWAVADAHARDAIEALFEALLERGEPVGAALRDVRARFGEHAPTFLSYVYYGDVNARFAPITAP